MLEMRDVSGFDNLREPTTLFLPGLSEPRSVTSFCYADHMLRGVDISSLRPKYGEGAFSAGCVFLVGIHGRALLDGGRG